METNHKKKIIAIMLLITFLATMFSPLVLSQITTRQTTLLSDGNWWNTQWPYRKLITIDHTKVSSDLVNYPMLLAEALDPDLAAATQPNGQDIVFIRYADNTTVLNHEIESYNHLSGQLTAWVRLPTISSTSDTKLWMYYGNLLCGPQENIPGTWDNSYVMVQHLNETGTTMVDSTSYHANGVSTGTNYTASGKIDGSQLYNGNDRIVVNNLISSSTALTFESWVYRDATAFIYIACKGTYSNQNDWLLYLRNNQPADQGIDFSIRNHTAFLRKGDTPVNTWFHLSVTFDNGNVVLYLNGDEIGNASGWPAISSYFPSLGLGNDVNGTEGGLYPMTQVMLDEIRVSTTARSDDWISTSFTNQNNPGSFSSIGTEQQNEMTLLTFNSPPAGGTITASPNPPYFYNDIVTLTAVPTTGYSFDHWSGDLTGTTNPQTLIMNSDKTVTANYILQNQPPVAKDDYATVQENSTDNQIDVLANDTDPDGDTLTIISVTQPTFGISSYDSSYTYYTPDKGYDGPDAFTYKIDDGNGGTATATVFITVLPINESNNPPNIPRQPVPDDGETNVSITTNLWWLGGDPDEGDSVTYDVYFGTTTTPPKLSSNQTGSTYDIPVLNNGTKYYWRIVSWDNHKATTPGPLWSFTTKQEEEPPETSINVTISRPLENSFYLRNFRLLRHTRNTIVYGPIIIKAEATAVNTSVTKVEFYIDGKLKKSDDTAPYTYRWAPLRSFKHTIQVKAYAASGLTATDEVTVFKWRLHPILLLGGAYILSELMT